MKNFWIGFNAHKTEMPYFEMHSPWWVSGEDMNDNLSICCAVRAVNKESAIEEVKSCFDERKTPKMMTWRFVEERKITWTPYSDRFKKADWMRW